MEFLDWTYYDNPVRVWAIALLVATLIFIGLYLFKTIVIRRAMKLATRTSTEIDDYFIEILHRTKLFFVLTVSLYVGSRVLILPGEIELWLSRITVIVLFVQAAIWGNGFISQGATRYRRRATVTASDMTAIIAFSFVARLILWTVILLLILDNLGVEITALIAGLGIGGIAVGLALQNILGDLFASLSIVLDKPFVIGDFIIVGDFMGTVEHVGLKTTRVRSLSGEQLIFSNNDLLQSRVRNYKRMQERRILFSFGVIYQTSYEKLAAIPDMIREIIEAQEPTRFDRAHFFEYGDSSLNFEVVYYVLDPDYNLYMDIQQAINLAMFRRFGEEGIEFAYPTQTLYLEGEMATVIKDNSVTAQPLSN